MSRIFGDREKQAKLRKSKNLKQFIGCLKKQLWVSPLNSSFLIRIYWCFPRPHPIKSIVETLVFASRSSAFARDFLTCLTPHLTNLSIFFSFLLKSIRYQFLQSCLLIRSILSYVSIEDKYLFIVRHSFKNWFFFLGGGEGCLHNFMYHRNSISNFLWIPILIRYQYNKSDWYEYSWVNQPARTVWNCLSKPNVCESIDSINRSSRILSRKSY